MMVQGCGAVTVVHLCSHLNPGATQSVEKDLKNGISKNVVAYSDRHVMISSISPDDGDPTCQEAHGNHKKDRLPHPQGEVDAQPPLMSTCAW